MNIKPDNEYIIEQFTLEPDDYRSLSDFIQSQFINDDHPEGGTIYFTEENFRLMFGSPSSPRDTFIRAIHRESGDIVGFLGGIPRTVAHKGTRYRCLIPSYAVVHWKHRRKKLAMRMGRRLLEMALERGYNISFSFLIPEDSGIDFEKKFCGSNDLKMKVAVRINRFMIRIFDVDRISSVMTLKFYEKWGLKLFQSTLKTACTKVRPPRPDDGERMHELMKDHAVKNDLSIIWDHEEFMWYINRPELLCAVYEGDDGLVKGFITAFQMNIAGFNMNAPMGCVEIVHTYRLSVGEATEMCKYFCLMAKGKGWTGLQTPLIPYYDTKPFRKSKFILFPKKMVIGMFAQPHTPLPENIDSAYLDWR